MKFAAGFVAGLPLGIAGLIGGTIVMFVAVVAAVLAGWYWGRAVGAGALVALGVLWAALFTIAAYDCSRPEMPCGATPPDLAPHVIVSLILVAVGLVWAALPGQRSRFA